MKNKVLYYSIPIFKVLLYALLVFLISLPFSSILDSIVIRSSLWFDVVSEAIVVLVQLAVLLLMGIMFKQYHFAKIFIVKKGIFTGFLKGSCLGFLLLVLCAALALVSGNVSFMLGNISLPIFMIYIFYYILVGVFEEFFFRTFPLYVFAERYHVWIAIGLTSVLFGLAHAGNPGFTWLAMLNITLAGILFAVLILLKRNIYWAVGFHFAWNFTQGTILGYKVSGSSGDGVLLAQPIGTDYLSGGNFGIESSIYCTAAMLVLLTLLLRKLPIDRRLIVDQQN